MIDVSKNLIEAVVEFLLALAIAVVIFTANGLEDIVHFVAITVLAFFAGQYLRHGHL